MSAEVTGEFRLLGPMELRVKGQPAKLPGPAERTVLALLLLAPGRTVPASTLIDRLWSEGVLPDNPANALQLRVSKLRRALGALGLDLVHREASGYRVEVDPNAVDVQVFADQIRRARIEAARGGPPSPDVVTLYASALELWRGDPLADFAGELWATVASARLVQLRLSALAEHAQVALALGRHSDVAASLGPVVREQPQQEALAGLLMTALYQGGRQAEAVEICLRTQTALDRELGLEPSAQLRALYQRVLRQDPTLSPPLEAPVAAGAAGASTQPPGVDGGQAAPALIGRDVALRAVTELLASSRLVTLVGPGGAGKTALAGEVARQLEGSYEHGVKVARLAAVKRSADLTLAVADSVGVPLDGADPRLQARDRLIAYLRSRRMLLVLDNCEHVVDAAAHLADAIVSAAPGVVVLATSREALAVTGELQFAVAPLDVPPEGTAPQDVQNFGAGQLLLQRARAVRSDLSPTPADLLAVGQICRQLDGMPLALELAAARIGSLGFADVAARLGDRFNLLTTGPRTAEDRHRTLRNTVEWSHALLSPQEQLVFRRLAVFQNGWTLPAAESVVTDDGVPPTSVLDLLSSLVGRSMVVSDPGSPARFRMLETLRHYALERLQESGESDLLAAKHGAFFLTLAEQADADLRGPGQRDALRQLRREHANLRAALTWFSSRPEHADDALRLGGALGLYWHLGRHVEGREVLRALLRSVPNGGAAGRARALQAVSLVE
jgi:predicted ATPase/DNA-binding SARP family transcriptional activator